MKKGQTTTSYQESTRSLKLQNIVKGVNSKLKSICKRSNLAKNLDRALNNRYNNLIFLLLKALIHNNKINSLYLRLINHKFRSLVASMLQIIYQKSQWIIMIVSITVASRFHNNFQNQYKIINQMKQINNNTVKKRKQKTLMILYLNFQQIAILQLMNVNTITHLILLQILPQMILLP